MSKKTTTAKTVMTKADMIAEYRKLGADMKQLRVDHLADIEKLIEKYKADKAELQSKREKLLAEIRKPAEKKAEPAAA